jgi:hypothetical protein
MLTAAAEGCPASGHSRSGGVDKVHHVLTIEVDPKRRAIVQARGWANRAATGKPLRLLQDWAAQERLQLAI